MPYAIVKRKRKFAVVNLDTGETKGTHDSREGAQKQVNLLRGIEHGWKPTRRD